MGSRPLFFFGMEWVSALPEIIIRNFSFSAATLPDRAYIQVSDANSACGKEKGRTADEEIIAVKKRLARLE